jgi:hypothetical protein
MAYEIGYRRPPPSGQFKKGASGNPKGRPKGSKNLVTLLHHELNQKVTVNEGGRRRSVTRMQAMVMRLVAAALQGEPKAVMTLLDILRRNGGGEQATPELLVPENYRQILADYVATQGRKGGVK